MTPERRVRKREQSKSPLNELDDEPLPTHDDSVGFSASAIADIVRHEIRTGISPLEARLTSMETVLGNRVDNIDQQLKNHGDRIEKMEALLGSKDATPRSCTSEYSLSMEKQIADLQLQIDGLRVSPKTDKPEPAKVMVVGGLATLTDMQSATTWVTNTLVSMRGPSIISTYIKPEKFQGLLFVKFASVVDRDTAVALLRSGSLKIGDSPVWATQDLPVPVRVRKLFLMGLRWQLAQWGFWKQEIDINDDFTCMHIGTKMVVKVANGEGRLLFNWAEDWAQWAELQQSEELRQLIERSQTILQKHMGKGLGKSKSKSTPH